MVYTAFLSYSREDLDFARRLAQDLKAAGVTVWLDAIELSPGKTWDRAIQDALIACTRMVVILSPASTNSANVWNEVSFALDNGKKVIPVRYRECTTPFRLNNLQYVDIREDYSAAVKQLVESLTSYESTELESQALASQLNNFAGRFGKSRPCCLHVYPRNPADDDFEVVKRLGAAAAPLIRNLLIRSALCGVTWGGVLGSVVTGLRNLAYPTPWSKKPIEFVPLNGEPLGKERDSFGSSSLARDLGEVVNGDEYEALSLAMVPAFIPDSLHRYERDGAWRMIELVNAYSLIYGSGHRVARREKPKALRLEMILTGVSSRDRPLGMGHGLLFQKRGIYFTQVPPMGCGFRASPPVRTG